MSVSRVSPINHDVRKMPENRVKVRGSFDARGESITQWALKRGFNPGMVSHVLNGRMKCDRGQAHRIAIELGLKPVPSTTAGE
jgi:gp16 family phage-associated protein